jgi:hypothetical protein
MEDGLYGWLQEYISSMLLWGIGTEWDTVGDVKIIVYTEGIHEYKIV